MEQQPSKVQEIPIVCVSLDGTESTRTTTNEALAMGQQPSNAHEIPIVCVSLNGMWSIQPDEEFISTLCTVFNVLPTQLYIKKVALNEITNLEPSSTKILCLIGIESLSGIDCSEILCLTICNSRDLKACSTFIKECTSLVFLRFYRARFWPSSPARDFILTSLKYLHFERCKVNLPLLCLVDDFRSCKNLKIHWISNTYTRNMKIMLFSNVDSVTIFHDTEGMLTMIIDPNTKVEMRTPNECGGTLFSPQRRRQINILPL